MDFFFNKIAGVLNKFAGAVPGFELPFHYLAQFIAVLNPHLAAANVIFPVDAVLTMLIILGGIRAVMLLIWGIEFIRKMLPL